MRRRVSLSNVHVRCPDHWGEVKCWKHSRPYRKLCREDDNVCPWEIVRGHHFCPVSHSH